MWRVILILLTLALARPVAACETALLLAVDVSGSISLQEYHLQMEGLAQALEDPAIVDALVTGQDGLALVHWSGSRHQTLSLGWHRLQDAADVAAFAAAVRATRRPQLRTVTAIGDAIRFSLAQFGPVQDCDRHVIDISGDGAENEGQNVATARREAEAARVIINAIAIELDDRADNLTGYFRRFVITPDGFAITAHGLPDYPRAIRQKLLRELTRAVS